MFSSRLPPSLLLALLLTTAPVLSASTELPPRPKLDQYANEEAFVKDVLAWEKRKRELEAQGRLEQETASEAESRPGDWHHITGPENLDEALRNAYGYEQPDYKEKYRFNRTTHISFPLERLGPGQLSRSAITGGLHGDQSYQRSLQPLPELRTILEETSDMLELGELAPRQELEPPPEIMPPVTQRVDVDPR